MGLEIERKFLTHQHLLPELKQGVKMIQGYLSEKPSVRFRIIKGIMVMTIKEYISAGKRFELETPGKEISAEEEAKLKELSITTPIIKIRYKIKDNEGLTWEIDQYQGENAGLITVDVELPREDYSLTFPDWVDSSHDITSDPRYSNVNLGRCPYTRWK